MKFDTEEALSTLVSEVLDGTFASTETQSWTLKTRQYLDTVRERAQSELDSAEFLSELFNNTTLSETGMGSVKVDHVVASAAFRATFAAAARAALSSSPERRQMLIRQLYDETILAFEKGPGRIPRLKVNRALAALFPQQFTTLAAEAKLRFLSQVLGGSVKDHPVELHSQIRHKLDVVARNLRPGLSEAELLCLPWLVYIRISSFVGDADTQADQSPSAQSTSTLQPKPAHLRRKGLTALRDYSQTLRLLTDYLLEGPTRDDFEQFIQQQLEYSHPSARAVVSQLKGEFGVWYQDGDRLRLTPLGLSIQKNEDLDDLGDHLITRILGVDHVLAALLKGPIGRDDLHELLRKVNPNWTSNFGPSAILKWLVSLEALAVLPDATLKLTERGSEWASRVTWIPEKLVSVQTTVDSVIEPTQGTLELSAFSQLLAKVTALANDSALKFGADEIASLHSALWFHPVRHFVVMAGLSGTGKTRLAKLYADGLCASKDRVLVQPVEPGWFDSTSLLGFVDPIKGLYRSTPFVRFLLAAASDPKRPYVVILDEMNLSHPEQYMAPLLSAMESGEAIHIHDSEDASTSGIEKSVPYPSNLAIIGTVNMDETTHGLSDKVLDRAYTLEFWDVKVDDFPGWSTSPLQSEDLEKVKKTLQGLAGALSPVRMHFGWRTINDVMQFVHFSGTAKMSASAALDAVVYAKVLPKIRGEATAQFHGALEKTASVLSEAALPRSLAKVKELQADLHATGTARFWR
jgi:hypothetical protein